MCFDSVKLYVMLVSEPQYWSAVFRKLWYFNKNIFFYLTRYSQTKKYFNPKVSMLAFTRLQEPLNFCVELCNTSVNNFKEKPVSTFYKETKKFQSVMEFITAYIFINFFMNILPSLTKTVYISRTKKMNSSIFWITHV